LSRFQPLLTSRLFSGQGAKGQTSQLVPRVDLPRLEGYRLVGLMAGSRQFSWAVVEEMATGRQEMVGLGDGLGSGVVVDVRADRLVVEIGGQPRQLQMPDRSMEEMSEILTVKREELSRAGLLAALPEENPSAGTSPAPTGGLALTGAGAGFGLGKGDSGQALGRAEAGRSWENLAQERAMDPELKGTGR